MISNCNMIVEARNHRALIEDKFRQDRPAFYILINTVSVRVSSESILELKAELFAGKTLIHSLVLRAH